MGLKLTELITPFSNGPTALTPPSKSDTCKFFQVTRADIASTLKAVLPAQASVISVTLFGSANSNAGTTAGLTVNISNNTGVISTGTANLLTGGATTADLAMSALPNIEPQPLLGDLKVSVQYAETGTASTLGGPWVMRVNYV